MRKLIGTWNPTRGLWETGTLDLLSEHSEPFSETWPTWGMTRSGVAFELPTRVPLMDASGSSSLPTPRASRGASGTETMYRLGGERDDSERSQGQVLLKTPTSQLAINGGSQHPDKRKAGGHGPTLADEVEHLLPTPIVSDGTGGPKNLAGALFSPQLREISQLLPTPTTADANGSGGSKPSNVTLTDATVRTRLGAITNPRFEGGSE